MPTTADASAPRSGRSLTLRARLGIAIPLAVVAVGALQSSLQIAIFERAAERDLRATAHVTAVALSDELELQPEPLEAAGLHQHLQPYVELPPIRTVSLFVFDQAGADWNVSTAVGPRPQEWALAREAFQRGTAVWGEPAGPLQTLAMPVERAGRRIGAVAVTISLFSAQELESRGWRVMVLVTLATAALLALLIDWSIQRLVYRPLGHILETMRRAGSGDLQARVRASRDDELGELGKGLDELLDRVEGFNVDLERRVGEATRELRERNRELRDTYQRLFSLRETLARVEQLAAAGHTAANLAHQIGTPLNLISGYTQMLLEEDDGADARRAARLHAVQDQTRKLTELVQSTLAAVRRPPVRARVDPGALVGRVSEIVRPLVAATGVDLHVEIDSDLPPISADATQLELALLNLVSNSVDAMPDGGTLTLWARRTASGVRLTVTDTGTGIPPDLLPRIFEPWVTTKPVGRGTGLGLSITRDVVASLGGQIAAESEPGRGSAFVIDLPVDARHMAARDGAATGPV